MEKNTSTINSSEASKLRKNLNDPISWEKIMGCRNFLIQVFKSLESHNKHVSHTSLLQKWSSSIGDEKLISKDQDFEYSFVFTSDAIHNVEREMFLFIIEKVQAKFHPRNIQSVTKNLQQPFSLIISMRDAMRQDFSLYRLDSNY